MHFELATQTGFYGFEEDPSEEYFRVEASNEDVFFTFNASGTGPHDFYVRRQVNVDNNEFVEALNDDPHVYPDSDVTVVPEFPIGKDPYEDTVFTMYQVMDEERRKSDAIVDVSLEDPSDKVRWVNLEHDPQVQDPRYENEVWYIGTEIDEDSILRYLCQEPVEEEELSDLLVEVNELFALNGFENV